MIPIKDVKKYEIVMCFPQALFGGKGGIISPTLTELAENVIWVTRDMANANTETLRQAATYTSIVKFIDGNYKVALYTRTGGDEKLKGSYSIGYGGHVNMADFLDSLDQLNDHGLDDRADARGVSCITQSLYETLFVVLTETTYRELKEETGLDSFDESGLFSSVFTENRIVENSNDIGSYHVGFPSILFTEKDITPDDGDVSVDSFVGWKTLDELKVMREEGCLESWSNYMIDRWIANKQLHNNLV